MIRLEDVAAACSLTVEQLTEIENYIVGTETYTPEYVRQQINWFVNDLGIDDYYFRTTETGEIARHILLLGTSELAARHGGDSMAVQLVHEEAERAVYIVEQRGNRQIEIEKRIEERYPAFRLESYGTAEKEDSIPLQFYVLTKPRYSTDSRGAEETFQNSATVDFIETSLPDTLKRYEGIWNELHDRLTPAISVSRKAETREIRFMIGLQRGGERQILTGFSHLFHRLGARVTRKYIEPFQDGSFILSFYVPDSVEPLIPELERELGMVSILPDSPIGSLFHSEVLSAQETMYAAAAAAFTHQFISEQAEGYQLLEESVRHQMEAKGVLDSLRRQMAKNTFSTRRISSTVAENIETVRLLYRQFEGLFGTGDPVTSQEVEEALERDVAYHRDRAILRFFCSFNELIDRTNFFQKTQASVAFRMKSGFLGDTDYPDEPWGVFFVVGRQFNGFHVRFRDIARGGIRIVRSRTADMYARNVDTLFQENYNLSSTQQKKNKDIPEGGSKGMVLVHQQFSADPVAADSAFQAYADGLLDLLRNDGSDEPKEVLFLGPDEGSANLMDWAALHARKQGYRYWKSFTTGKSLALGGIPHDRYGMTTESVHTYVTATLEKLGKDESKIRKIQTGGPDGDLGSNEILISKDITIGIVDGSGVLYDPDGLNRPELVRLAKARLMCDSFDQSKLGGKGFFVALSDKEVTLPDGTVVHNGEDFRNHFHLTHFMTADLFVPCGGRPGAFTAANWKSLLDDGGKPRIPIIVEGANLFITHEARLQLEKAGVILFKDASTNKGGVTSSSLEVYAGLALTDEQWEREMSVLEGQEESPLRLKLVQQIVERIRDNARKEFELLWAEHHRTGVPFTELSDTVSANINRIADAVRSSSLLDDDKLRSTLLQKYTPSVLQELVTVAEIQDRVPRNYQDAIIAAAIGSDFVYTYGLHSTEVDFSDYLDALR